ncbi:MAG: non-canonical purine NTP pyrophosphatase [bacterium]|nr:non-canonical purine NTP pyrophosphatase [bacterium]
MTELWIATGNAKKRAELERLLGPLGITIRTPHDLRERSSEYDPIEDQPDFAGNARVKATALARLCDGTTLADDSGLCVDALDGRPGVHSARYGGPGLDDAGRVDRLLAELAEQPDRPRTARFVCSLCVCDARGDVLAAIEETCEGTLLTAPSGAGGFGYDPIFVAHDLRDEPVRSFAELPAAEKDRISHRGKALRRLAAELPALLARDAGR